MNYIFINRNSGTNSGKRNSDEINCPKKSFENEYSSYENV